MMEMNVPSTQLPAVMLFVKTDDGNKLTLLGVMPYSGILTSPSSGSFHRSLITGYFPFNTSFDLSSWNGDRKSVV